MTMPDPKPNPRAAVAALVLAIGCTVGGVLLILAARHQAAIESWLRADLPRRSALVLAAMGAFTSLPLGAASIYLFVAARRLRRQIPSRAAPQPAADARRFVIAAWVFALLALGIAFTLWRLARAFATH